MKKPLNRLIFFWALLIICYSFYSLLPKAYEYTYKINKFQIKEKYDKETKSYLFDIAYKNNVYAYSLPSKYIHHRGIIENIKHKNDCYYIASKYILNFSFCVEGNEITSTFLNKDIKAEKTDVYENIEIYNLMNHKFFIWNYTHFLIISEKNISKIKLFKNDYYELEFIVQIKDNLLIADYDQEYYFDKMILINSKKDSFKEVELDRKIYHNSYILGTNKNFVYFYDIQKKKEYKYNPFNEKLYKIDYKYMKDGNWYSTTSNKLNKKKIFFSNQEDYGYVLDNNKLYYKLLNNRIKISNLNVDRLLYTEENTAFFISGDELYYVDFNKGVTKVMKYSEWLFNNKNIYIF